MASPAQKRVNLAVLKIVPPGLLGVVVYATYAVTKPLCIDYLLHPLPSYNRPSRVGAGAAILAIYYVLLIVMVGTYLRLFYNVVRDPGFLPLGAERLQNDSETHDSKPAGRMCSLHRRKSCSKTFRGTEKEDQADIDLESGTHAGGKAFQLDAAGLESFYTKDIFICQEDGRPPYCSTCCQFKTDRAHHCREVDRCVRKMDHFCPWVGGVVSETSFKFFIQFVVYTALFCAFALIVAAYFTAELRRNTGSVNPHWCVCIGLSAFFGFFSAGMALSSIQLAMWNVTTIENLNRRSIVWTLAIRVPEHLLERLWVSDSPWAPTFRMVSYPSEPPIFPSQTQPTDPSTQERHVFAILHTLPGENIFDLGSPFKNLQQVMGYNVLDWLLPFTQSPCADHSSLQSAFALGPVVTRIKQEAGLANPENGPPSRPRTADHRRRR
ncbi:hypothetical protein N7492_000398, partial [Penicillium capsulatum]